MRESAEKMPSIRDGTIWNENIVCRCLTCLINTLKRINACAGSAAKIETWIWGLPYLNRDWEKKNSQRIGGG